MATYIVGKQKYQYTFEKPCVTKWIQWQQNRWELLSKRLRLMAWNALVPLRKQLQCQTQYTDNKLVADTWVTLVQPYFKVLQADTVLITGLSWFIHVFFQIFLGCVGPRLLPATGISSWLPWLPCLRLRAALRHWSAPGLSRSSHDRWVWSSLGTRRYPETTVDVRVLVR